MDFLTDRRNWDRLKGNKIRNDRHNMMIKSKPFVAIALLAAAVILASCDSQSEGQSEVVPATKTIGMVSSAHPIATEAGLEILTKGGNAFDAAVTIASTLNVVEPMNSGIGGYGTILVYDAKKKKIRFLDSSGKIPAAVDSDVFRKPNPDYKKNRYGPKAVSLSLIHISEPTRPY